MTLPFSVDEFLGVFSAYNAAIWPAPPVLAALAVLAAGLVFARAEWSGRIIAGLLAVLWLWAGAVYHMGFFARINPAAYAFGVAFMLQGLLLLWAGAVRGRFRFRAGRDLRTAAAAVLILYALFVYPLLGLAFGHRYPAAPTFGAPCPVTIFTIGMLLIQRGGWQRLALVLPLSWSVVGGSAAVLLAVREDLGLIVAGLAAAVFMVAGPADRHGGAAPAAGG